MRLLSSLLVAAFLSLPASAASIVLDFDTLGTGSDLANNPLVTALGTITATRLQVRDPGGDLEFIAAGATGNVGDILTSGLSTILSFDFTASSVTFIYGGNFGGILVEALDGSNNVVASFTQADTSAGQPAGPTTLTAANIRAIRWSDTDPGGTFAALDNVLIETASVPEPSTWMLGSLALGILAARRRFSAGR